MGKAWIEYLRRFKGQAAPPPGRVSAWREVGCSVIGAFIGLYIVASINHQLGLNGVDQLLLIGSFGATAVLLYAAPYSELAQPRNLLCGHAISALVGISSYKLLSFDIPLACATAVAIAIGCMLLSKSLHPPGGATALTAVTGSEHLRDLGYSYVFFPILEGACVMLLIALLVNNLPVFRRSPYPLRWW